MKNDTSMKNDTLVSGNAGDEKKSSTEWPWNVFLMNLIGIFK